MDKVNTGSFGAPIGGSQDLIAAMQRRGGDASALQAMSPASVGGGVPMPPTEMESAQAALPQSAVQPPAPEQPDSELKIALQALGGFVKSEGSMRRDMVKMQGMGGY